MSIVTITINNKNFQLACEDGTENTLIELAAKLNQKVEQLKQTSPRASTELLLLMTSLSLQDEVNNLQSKLNKPGTKSSGEEEKLAETLNVISEYLETLAQKIGK